jgi:hypothetical protein
MKKSILAFLLAFTITSCQELLEVLNSNIGGGLPGITQAEASSGLKQALEKGVILGTSSLGQSGGFLNNASYKILMPTEVQKCGIENKGKPGN